LRTTISASDKLRGFLAGARPRVPRHADDPAVILFTLGSEGAPKGVVTFAPNILANAAQALGARRTPTRTTKSSMRLPVFHRSASPRSDDAAAGRNTGLPISSPLHYRIVPELIYQTNSTILFGTDTFLSGYARSAHAYDFHSLRLVLAGAEALKDRTRAIYMQRFGLRLLEGYGVTETSPVLAMNTAMANKPGTVGRLLRADEARLEQVPGIAEGGRLYVSGPNVMLAISERKCLARSSRSSTAGTTQPATIRDDRRRGFHHDQGTRHQARSQGRGRDDLALRGRDDDLRPCGRTLRAPSSRSPMPGRASASCW